MRFDREGTPHTLEEDIQNTWKEHGLEVTEETVTSDKAITTWTIKARRIVGYVPKIPS